MRTNIKQIIFLPQNLILGSRSDKSSHHSRKQVFNWKSLSSCLPYLKLRSAESFPSLCGDSNGAVPQFHRHFGRLNLNRCSVLVLKSTSEVPDSLTLLQSGAVL